MIVSELITKLQKIDGARTVVLSMDPEGNKYNLLDDAWLVGAYSRRGEVGLEKLTDEDRQNGYIKEDVVEGLPALILYPEGNNAST